MADECINDITISFTPESKPIDADIFDEIDFIGDEREYEGTLESKKTKDYITIKLSTAWGMPEETLQWIADTYKVHIDCNSNTYGIGGNFNTFTPKGSPLCPTHDCRDFTIYHVAGEIICEHPDHNSDFDNGEYFFTDFGMKAKDLADEYYSDWDDPTAKYYEEDKDMKEFFDKCQIQSQGQKLYEKCINEKIEFPEGVAP